jgi:hypothetical protein
MTLQDKEWESKDNRQMWTDKVSKAKDVITLCALMKDLNEGMSLPTSLIQRENKTQRMKL